MNIEFCLFKNHDGGNRPYNFKRELENGEPIPRIGEKLMFNIDGCLMDFLVLEVNFMYSDDSRLDTIKIKADTKSIIFRK